MMFILFCLYYSLKNEKNDLYDNLMTEHANYFKLTDENNQKIYENQKLIDDAKYYDMMNILGSSNNSLFTSKGLCDIVKKFGLNPSIKSFSALVKELDSNKIYKGAFKNIMDRLENGTIQQKNVQGKKSKSIKNNFINELMGALSTPELYDDPFDLPPDPIDPNIPDPFF